MGILCLLRKRESRGVDHVIEKPHGNTRRLLDAFEINPRLGREWRLYKARQIKRSQVTSAIRWERNFSAWIGGGELFSIPTIVEVINAINEQDTRLGVVVGGMQNAFP